MVHRATHSFISHSFAVKLGMQCSDEEKVRIVRYFLGSEACKWWVMERGTRLHT